MVLTEDEARARTIKELTRLLDGAPLNYLRLFFGPPGPHFSDPDFLWSQLSILFMDDINSIRPLDHLAFVNYFMEQELTSLLFQFIVEFPSSTTTSPQRPLGSMWALALAVLGNISHFCILHGDKSPQIAAALTISREHIVMFMRVLVSPDCDEFWNSANINLNPCIYSISRVLAPVFGSRTPITKRDPVLRFEMCQAAIPLLTKMRKWIALNPFTTQSLIASILSAEHLVQAVYAIVQQKWSLDLVKATGFTHNEILNHTINLPANTSDSASEELRIKCRIMQLNVMDVMFKLDSSASFIAAFASEKALTWSVWAMRSILEYSASNPDSESVSESSLLPMLSETVLFWTDIFKHPSHLRGPSVEAVECNLVFLFETWSMDASSKHLARGLRGLVELGLKLQDLAQIKYYQIFKEQLQAVASRAHFRSSLRRELVDGWMETYKKLTPSGTSPLIRDVCGAVGCIRLNLPGLQCARCKKMSYCDKGCQKRDWKTHKKDCQRAT